MRNPQSRVTYGPNSGMNASNEEVSYQSVPGERSHAETETRMIDTTSSRGTMNSNQNGRNKSASEQNKNRNQSSNAQTRSLASRPSDFDQIWGVGEDGNVKKNAEVIDEQSQGDSSDGEVEAAYTVIKKDRRDSFSDEDENPMRQRDANEVDDFFNFVGDIQ